MAFKPKEITKEHILRAVERVKREQIELIPSTRWDVEINGELYPPKDIMRYAHEEMNGEHSWEYGGGENTNRFLKKLGFSIIDSSTKKVNKDMNVKEKFRILVEQVKLEIKKESSVLKDFTFQKTYTGYVWITDHKGIIGNEEAHYEIQNHPDKESIIVVLHFETKPENKKFYNSEIYNTDIQENPNIEWARWYNANSLRYSTQFNIDEDNLAEKVIKALNVLEEELGDKVRAFITKDKKQQSRKYLIASLTWNSNKWTKPSDDKSNHRYIQKGGLAHESWNFDFENSRNTKDKIYGFAQFHNAPDIEGNNNLVILYSQNKIVGFYGKCEILKKGVKNDNEQICNLIATRNLSIALDNYIDDVKENGFLEELQRVSQGGFSYLKDKKNINAIIEKAQVLNPNQFEELKQLQIWVNSMSNEPEEKEETNMSSEKLILNQILFGPPGTGKTYRTINEAIKITNSNFYKENKDNRETLKKEFNELIEKGQIVFTTFHQSMSYEDFVEGIKPNEPKEEGQPISYSIEDGIFKRIVEKIKEADEIEDITKENLFIEENKFTNPINKVSLGNSNLDEDSGIYDYCIENNCIAIGFGEDIDFTGVKDRVEIRKRFKENGVEINNSTDFKISAIQRLVIWMKPGQLVFVSNGNRKLKAIGEVTGDYYCDVNTPLHFSQFRKVKWLYKDLDLPIKEIYGKEFSQQTIYQIDSKKINKDIFQNKPLLNKTKPNYVLIIDEINRGNVSSIFGELITLIEKDKRAGGDEPLSVMLPYSKESFSVPSNLFIIGTMNTADRSVEALDTALRRRFSFKEMPPKHKLLDSKRLIWEFLWKNQDYSWDNKEFKQIENEFYSLLGSSKDFLNNRKKIWAKWEKAGKDEKQISDLNIYEFDGINLKKLLKDINLRIEKLIDKDHMIGHSYFLNIKGFEDLKIVFKDKIIPLLEEYFYGDYGKINLILGNAFVSKKDKEEQFSFAKSVSAFEEDIITDLINRTVFVITDYKDWTEEDFVNVYK